MLIQFSQPFLHRFLLHVSLKHPFTYPFVPAQGRQLSSTSVWCVFVVQPRCNNRMSKLHNFLTAHLSMCFSCESSHFFHCSFVQCFALMSGWFKVLQYSHFTRFKPWLSALPLCCSHLQPSIVALPDCDLLVMSSTWITWTLVLVNHCAVAGADWLEDCDEASTYGLGSKPLWNSKLSL